jgi:D-serine dehydratase
MRAAKLDRSARLQRTRDYLAATYPRWASTRDIITGAHIVAVSAAAAELRQNNVPVDCKREGDVWWYRLDKGE